MQHLLRLIPAMPQSDTLRGNKAKTRRNKDGAWEKKGTKSFFVYKLHDCTDEKFGLVRRIEVNAANVHDSQVDLAEEGEVRYADKGYFRAKTKGYDVAMKKATRGYPLSCKDEMRNKRISRKRSPVERFYAFIKCGCKAGHVAVTTIPRVRVKMIITGIVFNAYHLASAKSKLEA